MSEDILEIRSHKGPYRVHFDENALSNLNGAIPDGAHFIVDDKVATLYASEMDNILAAPSVLRLVATEEAKSLERFPDYVAHLVDKGVRRDHVLIAIGGGIIQDITCFLSATLLRGVEWRFLPTTLLAQADSCIGSKSSINTGAAKNILGTFTPPKEIHLATRFQETLDPRDVRSGIGEMLKVHVIDGPDSFDALAADFDRLTTDRATMIRYVRRSLAIKKGYIETDEFDQGPRNIFNYGHSFGHAIEAATRFAIPHGIAVTIGMDMANWISAQLGVGQASHWARMRPPLRANYSGFETHPVPLDPFLAALAKDKKNVGSGSATLILPGQDARVSRAVYPVDERFRELCRQFLEEVRPQ